MFSLTIESNRLSMLAFCVLICLCSVTTVAQDESAQTAEGETRDILTDIEKKMQKVVTIDANDLPIGLVMAQLIDQTDVNLVISPNVTGQVTVSLTNVTLKEALQSILDVHGAAYIPGKNVISILPIAEMQPVTEMLVTETFQVKHVDVNDVVVALEKFKSENGSVSFIAGSNHIIVTDTQSKIRDIGNLLNKVDGVTPQILVEVRIYDVTSKDNLDLGIEWGASRRTNFSGTSDILNDDITLNDLYEINKRHIQLSTKNFI